MTRSEAKTYQGFATMSSPMMWALAALFGIPAVYGLTLGLAGSTLAERLFNVAKLSMGLFMLYCAVRAYQGKRAVLASRGIVMLGQVCLGLFVLCFLAKIGVIPLPNDA
ncbi:hypothetical protein [Massilia consociata]|uniref:Uncharacterized protein n=1 Tax=Massilia consociata TaxID=760117 RepID=A0ABV6FFP0_9BURK